MKYLKSINENFSIGDSESLEEIQSIKDVFQDIVDEFNMEETDELSCHDHQEGFYYYFIPSYDGQSLLLFIYVWHLFSPENRIEDFKKIFNRISDFKERLSNMGYKVISEDKALSNLRTYGDFLIEIIPLD